MYEIFLVTVALILSAPIKQRLEEATKIKFSFLYNTYVIDEEC